MISYLTPGYPAALFEALAEQIGVELGFDVGRSGPDPLVDPFAAGTADLGWLCSTSFVELTTGRRPSVQEVAVAWVPDDPDGADRPVYFSDVLVSSDSLGPWPTQPVVMRVDAGPDEVSAVRDALLRANDDPEIVELLAASALTRLTSTQADRCEEVRAAMARLAGVTP